MPSGWHDRLPALVRLGVRAFAVAAMMLGILGMHVLSSPGSHAAHSPSAGASTVAHAAPAHEPHEPMADRAGAPPCDRGCDDPAGEPAQDAWSLVCVLALLIAALLIAPRGSSWLLARRALSWRASAVIVPTHSEPRHPPSLTLLSISRT